MFRLDEARWIYCLRQTSGRLAPVLPCVRELNSSGRENWQISRIWIVIFKKLQISLKSYNHAIFTLKFQFHVEIISNETENSILFGKFPDKQWPCLAVSSTDWWPLGSMVFLSTHSWDLWEAPLCRSCTQSFCKILEWKLFLILFLFQGWMIAVMTPHEGW